MSASTLSNPVRRRTSSDTASSTAPSPWLRLVPSVPTDAPRAPFIVFVIGLLGIGLIGLLLLNTSLQKRAFELSSLQRSTAVLADQQSELEQQAGQLSAPENVAARAAELGMVPNPNPVFLRLSDGKVLGNPVPAAKPVIIKPAAPKRAAAKPAATKPAATKPAATKPAATKPPTKTTRNSR